MIRRPPRSTLFPYTTSSDLQAQRQDGRQAGGVGGGVVDAGEHYVLEAHPPAAPRGVVACRDRKSTRLNSSHSQISYAVFCLKKKKTYCTYCWWLSVSESRLY